MFIYYYVIQNIKTYSSTNAFNVYLCIILHQYDLNCTFYENVFFYINTSKHKPKKWNPEVPTYIIELLQLHRMLCVTVTSYTEVKYSI